MPSDHRICVVAALVLGAMEAEAATLDLGSSAATVDYHSTLSAGGSITCGAGDCVRVDIVDRHNGTGGVFILQGSGGWAASLPRLAADQDVVFLTPDITELGFTVSADYNDWFGGALTADQQREFALQAILTVTPTHPVPGSPDAKQEETFTFGAGADGSHRFSFLPNWVDSDVKVSLVLRPDPAHLLNSPLPEWRFEPLPLRVRFLPDQLLSLPMLPLGIIGKPPGLESWSRITQSEGSVVNTAVREESTDSSTHSTRVGVGPIPLHSTDQVTQERRVGAGTAQLLGWENKASVDSANSRRNGEGDVLVLAQNVDVLLYHAALDADFLLQEVGDVVLFPMGELATQREFLAGRSSTPSSNSIVQSLSFRDIDNLIALNPLLQSPYAALRPPRFHKVGVAVNWQDTRFQQAFAVDSTQIQSALQATAMTTVGDSNFNLELPLNVVIKAVSGYDVPASLVNPRFSDIQVGTAVVRQESSVELTRHTGSVVEYQLYNSSGAQHCAEAYFDSLFNGLLFRDCTPLCDRPGALCLSDILRRTEQWWFDLVREADAVGRGRDFYVVGALRLDGPDDGSRDLRFSRVDAPGPFYRSTVDPKTGGFVLPNLTPGVYRAELRGEVHEIELTEQGDLRYQRRGKDTKSGFENAYTAADGSFAVRSFRDACTSEERTRRCPLGSTSCTMTHSLKDLCGDRVMVDKTCVTLGDRMICR